MASIAGPSMASIAESQFTQDDILDDDFSPQSAIECRPTPDASPLTLVGFKGPHPTASV